MDTMKKKIIIMIILLSIVSISGCINSTINNINQMIPQLTNVIIEGNNNFNLAADYTNNNDYNNADEKIEIAIEKFNEGEYKFLEINQQLNNVNDTIYIEYLNLIKEEISLKKDAASNLQLAIQFFKSGDNETANNYVSTANSLMDQGVNIQNQRAKIVKNHPDKFN